MDMKKKKICCCIIRREKVPEKVFRESCNVEGFYIWIWECLWNPVKIQKYQLLFPCWRCFMTCLCIVGVILGEHWKCNTQWSRSCWNWKTLTVCLWGNGHFHLQELEVVIPNHGKAPNRVSDAVTRHRVPLVTGWSRRGFLAKTGLPLACTRSKHPRALGGHWLSIGSVGIPGGWLSRVPNTRGHILGSMRGTWRPGWQRLQGRL